ncbi:Rab-GTPase-TBC domain-containing protein, partial [Helicosporidium sp. ATCC 50920]
MAVAFVQWLGQQVFNLTLGFSEDLEDDDEEEYVELQCGKTLFSAVPARMRTELWLSQLHHDAPSVQAVRRYYSFVNQTPPRSVAAEIEKDLHRTFPGHPRLSSDAGQHALRRLLCAYASCDPAIGYTQGMNFVAALVVLTIPSEPEAFGIFWLLMQRRGLRELYAPDMSMLQVRLWQLGALLPPDLGAHMDAAGALPVLYASSWLLTCFAADFPRSFAARVLDLVVAGAYAAPVMRVALGILHAAAPALKKTTDLERMVRFLRRDVPRAAHETLHELLSRAMERPWTPRQLAVLERINDTETVAQAVQRTSRGPSGAGGEDDWGEWKASGEEGEEQGIGKREEEPGMDVREHPRTEISLHRDPLSYIGSPLHSPPGPSGASTPTARALRSPSSAPAPVSRGQGPDLLAPRVDSLVLCLPSQPSTLAAASPADVEEEDTLRDEDEDSRHFRDVFARLSALPPTPLRPSVAPPSVGGGEARIDPVADPVLDPQLSLALSHYRPSQRGPGGVDLGLESQASFLDSQEAGPAPEPSDRPGRPFPLALAGSVASPGAHLPGVPSPFAAPSDRAAGGSAADLPWHGWHRRLSGGALGGGEEDGGDAALESSEFGSFH